MKNPGIAFTQKFFPIIFVTALALMGCNKGGGGSSNSSTNVYANCAGCGSMTTPILSNVRGVTPSGNVSLNVNIMGSGPSNVMNPQAVVFYSGPAVLSGTLVINNPQDSLICSALPGTYNINPLQPSMMASSMLQGGVYQATMGSSQITFRIINAILFNPDTFGVSNNNWINLNATLDSVNGIPCGTISTSKPFNL